MWHLLHLWKASWYIFTEHILETYGKNFGNRRKKIWKSTEKIWEIHGKYFGNLRKRRTRLQLQTPLLNREKDKKKLVIRSKGWALFYRPSRSQNIKDWNPSRWPVHSWKIFVKNYLKLDSSLSAKIWKKS